MHSDARGLAPAEAVGLPVAATLTGGELDDVSDEALLHAAGRTTVIAVTLTLPYLPASAIFGFVPLPAPLMLAMIGLTLVYVVAAEAAKRYFYSRAANAHA